MNLNPFEGRRGTAQAALKTRRLVSLLAACSLGLLTGCQTTEQPKGPSSITQSCKLPTITITPGERPESQEKGGIEIAVVPATYHAIAAEKVVLRQTQHRGIIWDPLPPAPNMVFVEELASHWVQRQPDRLEFSVRVNNKLDRVFRGQGAVVQFNVANKLVPFDNTDYKNFISGIVPPRNETILKIYGPSLDDMPDQGTIGIFLYDVVTATDVTGAVKEKQNFEWYFTYTMREEQLSLPQNTTKRRWVDVGEYQQRMMEEQRRNALQRGQQQTQQARPPGQ